MLNSIGSVWNVRASFTQFTIRKIIVHTHCYSKKRKTNQKRKQKQKLTIEIKFRRNPNRPFILNELKSENHFANIGRCSFNHILVAFETINIGLCIWKGKWIINAWEQTEKIKAKMVSCNVYYYKTQREKHIWSVNKSFETNEKTNEKSRHWNSPTSIRNSFIVIIFPYFWLFFFFWNSVSIVHFESCTKKTSSGPTGRCTEILNKNLII